MIRARFAPFFLFSALFSNMSAEMQPSSSASVIPIVPNAASKSLIVTIRVYNLASVRPAALAKAKRETARVFREAEVGTVWLNCPTAPEQLAENRACAAPMQATDMVIKILPKQMAEAFKQPRGVYGFAAPGANGGFGALIYLFHERVLDLAFHGTIASSYKDNQAIVLGCMMAHEIGHLLLGPKSHSTKGIMKSPWDRRDLMQAARTGLRFLPSEVERIRSALTRRSQATVRP